MPTLKDVSTILRLLARSATGQDMSVYTTVSTGPRRPGDPDGPDEYHVVILDNGRTAMLGTEYQEMLRCIRCGACMNHCPVYHAVGGHAYGATYPGPIGAVLDPVIFGLEKTRDLPNASTFCGRCESVCPMKIPLPKLMRHWREKEFERGAVAGDAALRHSRLGVLRDAAARSTGSPRASPWRALGTLPARRSGRFAQPAARRRLDEAPRHAGAGGPHLHGSLQARGSERHERRATRCSERSGARSARPATMPRGGSAVAARLDEPAGRTSFPRADSSIAKGASRSSAQMAEKRLRDGRAARVAGRRSGGGRPSIFAAIIFRCRSAPAPTSCSRACPGSARRISSG